MTTAGLVVVYDALVTCTRCGVSVRLVTDGARAYAAGTNDAGAIERDGAAVVVTCGELVATCGLGSCVFAHHNEPCGEPLTFPLGDDGRQVDAPVWGGWTSAGDDPEAVELLARYGEVVTDRG